MPKNLAYEKYHFLVGLYVALKPGEVLAQEELRSRILSLPWDNLGFFVEKDSKGYNPLHRLAICHNDSDELLIGLLRKALELPTPDDKADVLMSLEKDGCSLIDHIMKRRGGCQANMAQVLLMFPQYVFQKTFVEKSNGSEFIKEILRSYSCQALLVLFRSRGFCAILKNSLGSEQVVKDTISENPFIRQCPNVKRVLLKTAGLGDDVDHHTVVTKKMLPTSFQEVLELIQEQKFFEAEEVIKRLELQLKESRKPSLLDAFLGLFSTSFSKLSRSSQDEGVILLDQLRKQIEIQRKAFDPSGQSSPVPVFAQCFLLKRLASSLPPKEEERVVLARL